MRNFSTDLTEEAVIEYIDRQPKYRHVYKGTYAEVFKKLEEENRQVRYCNDHWFSFENPETEKLRQLWYKSLSKSESMRLYYGNGTVD